MSVANSNALCYSGDLPPVYFNMAQYCLEPAAERHPHKVALVVVSDIEHANDGAETWTYAELHRAVRRIACGLTLLGLERGDRVMIRMGNTSDYILTFFGAIAAGFVPLPSSSQLTAEEADFLLMDSGARILALADDMDIGDLPGHVQVIRPYTIQGFLAGKGEMDFVATKAEDPAFLVYTSGTTGNPKGVLHGHRSAWGRRPIYDGWYGIHEDDVMLHSGAFNWTYTLGVGLTDPWANGATTVLYNGNRHIEVWPRLIETCHASLFAAVPTLYRQILKYCDLDQYELSTLRHGLTAGEALPKSLLADWRATVGTPLYEALGMSEISTYISSSPTVPVREGSPGKPQKGRVIVALPVEGGDQPLPANKIGLLAVHRSDPGLMLGYWNRPEEEAEVFRGDWFVGGDLCRFDEDGYLWYEGRHDDLMNAMGYRVSPVEVERILFHHETVGEVAVAELCVREGVSIIAAYVVTAEGQKPDKNTLLTYAAEHLAPYKCPREIFFLDALPRSSNGKVVRRELHTMVDISVAPV
jgi:acyl-coenzyme A synthetase/AMP-(fatty) acid ligase